MEEGFLLGVNTLFVCSLYSVLIVCVVNRKKSNVLKCQISRRVVSDER